MAFSSAEFGDLSLVINHSIAHEKTRHPRGYRVWESNFDRSVRFPVLL